LKSLPPVFLLLNVFAVQRGEISSTQHALSSLLFSQLIAPMLRRSAFYHTPLPAQPATLSEFRLSERSHNWSSVKKPDRALIGDEVAQDCDQDFALS
jgi:hypothetical protein